MRKIYLLLTFTAMMVVIVNAPMMATGSEILDSDEVIVLVDNVQDLQAITYEAPSFGVEAMVLENIELADQKISDIELSILDFDLTAHRLTHRIDKADLQYRWYKEPDGDTDYNISHARSNC